MSGAGDELKRVHPFAYATHPRRLDRALRRREVDRDEYAILVWLYSRADRSNWIAAVTLAQLAEGVAWELTDDALYRRLRGLRQRGWIAYETRPGKKRHVYAIRLVHDGPTESEDSPGRQTLDDPGLRSTPSRMPPSRHFGGPRMEAGTYPDQEPTAERARDERVRVPRDGREKTTTRLEEGFSEQRLGSSDQDQVVGEGPGDESGLVLHACEESLLTGLSMLDPEEPPWTLLECRATAGVKAGPDGRLIWRDEPLPGEAGVLADARALVKAGLATWEALCDGTGSRA
jgi:hypothetical protein